MGIASVVNACAHIQNCQRAGLGLTSLPNTKVNLFFCLALHRAGLVSSVTRAGATPPPADALLTFETEPVTTANVATRRLWLGLKYHDNAPVMRRLEGISKPSRSITLKLASLQKVARGFAQGYVKGLAMGEMLFLATDQGVMEVREALQKRKGGLLLARVSPH